MTPSPVIPCMQRWAEAHFDAEAAPTQRRPGNAAALPKAPVVRTPLTEWDRRAIDALDKVTMQPGCPDKRFRAQMVIATYEGESNAITDGQRAYVYKLVVRYRRQIGDAGVVARAREVGGK